jgi:uncharacterized protein YjbJ (UPF0337 family)
MNLRTLKGDLNIAKGKLKQKWASMTGDTFQRIEGEQDVKIGRMQKQTAATRSAKRKPNGQRGGDKRSSSGEVTGESN